MEPSNRTKFDLIILDQQTTTINQLPAAVTAWNRSSNDTEGKDTPACSLYNFFMYAIVVGALCLFGFVGNLLAFVVFCRDKIKTSTSFLFQGLSVIDTLFLTIVFPLYSVATFVEYVEIYDYDDTLTVKVHLLPLAYIFQTATIWTTVLVGFNRYIAVCHPFKAARLCTVTQAKKQLAVVLVCSAVYTLPKFAEVPTPLGDNRVYNVVYNNVMYTVFLLFLPVLTLAVLNAKLIAALKELRRKRAEMQSLRQQQDNNTTFVLIVVVIVFIVCQTPALVNHIFWTLLPSSYRACGGLQFYFRRFSNAFAIANSAVNFPIYVLFNTRFRQVLAQTCGLGGKQRDGSSRSMVKTNYLVSQTEDTESPRNFSRLETCATSL